MRGRKERDEIGGQEGSDNPCSFGDNLEAGVGLAFELTSLALLGGQIDETFEFLVKG